MIRTHQRASTPGETYGDCLSACIASILELPLEEVPVFTLPPYTGHPFWQLELNDWLRVRGYTLVGYRDEDALAMAPECFHIVCGPPRVGNGVDTRHAVVAYGDRILFDPNHTTGGISKIDDRWVLVPTGHLHVKTRARTFRPWGPGQVLTVVLYGIFLAFLAGLTEILSR